MTHSIIIYSKECLDCIHPEEWARVRLYLQNHGIQPKVRRTVYRPDWHRKAAKLYGSEFYPAFLTSKDGQKIDFLELAKNLMEDKEYDMQRLFGAKRPTRKTRMARKKEEAQAEATVKEEVAEPGETLNDNQ